jgi:hypothetical protein
MRVFTKKQILAGAFPASDTAHQDLVKLAHEIIGANKHILAATILGSATKPGGTTIFSDLDLLLIIPDDLRTSLSIRETLCQLLAEADRLHVLIELIIIPESVAKTNWHSIRTKFRDHLTEVIHMGLIKGDPLRLAQHFFRSEQEEVGTYVCHKLETFERYFLTLPHLTEEEVCEVLGKTLSLGPHVARRVTGLKMGDKTNYNDEIYVVTKAYRELFDGDPAEISMAELWRLRQKYYLHFRTCTEPDTVSSTKAERRRWRRQEIGRYTKGVRELTEIALGEAINFLQLNLTIVNNTPSKKRRIRKPK